MNKKLLSKKARKALIKKLEINRLKNKCSFSLVPYAGDYLTIRDYLKHTYKILYPPLELVIEQPSEPILLVYEKV